jgi:hypothetical protein
MDIVLFALTYGMKAVAIGYGIALVAFIGLGLYKMCLDLRSSPPE